MTIFADASALVSLYNEKDTNHRKAKALIATLQESDQLLTSNFVFAEIVTVLSQRVNRQQAIDTGEYIKENLVIVRLTEEVESLSWEIFKKQRSKNVSFIDCTTFALFKLGVFDKAFTFDGDFKSNKIPVVV